MSATAPPYRGRFAPSPTGPLHLGSLLAAAGSYLQARARGGQWLLRVEDLDTPRVVPGATEEILRTLELYGFEWDGGVVRQSERLALYGAAFETLERDGLVFACSCSRKELAARQPAAALEEDTFYPGTCRNGAQHPERPLAYRFRVTDAALEFEDGLQGRFAQNVADSIGDFVIRRRDGLFAYQLAVVVDDHEQGITEVVRGCDLLSNTPRQILLQQALGIARPAYMHLPLLTEADGRKLSKSRRAVTIANHQPAAALWSVLRWLRQAPPPELARGSVRELWSWAIRAWNPTALRNAREIALDAVQQST
ncbi:MAG TPA: tRNA glutamyl-Q(34) synthetase GluQRS [Steroidobacteraceae bacterium]|nr:tRNA glutamyl-Q(34) synthetase GluQRS [Steroidobacteraceae bacterium]